MHLLLTETGILCDFAEDAGQETLSLRLWLASSVSPGLVSTTEDPAILDDLVDPSCLPGREGSGNGNHRRGWGAGNGHGLDDNGVLRNPGGTGDGDSLFLAKTPRGWRTRYHGSGRNHGNGSGERRSRPFRIRRLDSATTENEQ